MKNTIKLVALGACALAASSSAALAGSELPIGITTGLSIGMPLPEGVYDISIGSYGSQGAQGLRSCRIRRLRDPCLASLVDAVANRRRPRYVRYGYGRCGCMEPRLRR